MAQATLGVPTDVVRGLFGDFQNSGKEACSACWPRRGVESIQPQMDALPEIAPGFVDYHAASRILDEHGCYKMGGRCNRWTSWMRARLNTMKQKLDRPA